MNKALALEVARELNISPELSYTVCKSFHDGLREIMLEPEKCKGGIQLAKFLTLKFSEVKIKRSLNREVVRNKERKEQVLDNLTKYKRNEKKQTS